MLSTDLTTRFAPSPTGRLHLGHAMSAVLSHDLARRGGGRFLLRIEDIDAGRSRAAFVDGILEDLRWLGLAWDGPVERQSARMPLYAQALARLRAMGLVYPCVCTRADIAASASAPHGVDGALYPGTCRQRADLDLSGPHAWRLDVAAALARTGPLAWTDSRHGTETVGARPIGDVVLARKDIGTSYHLAVTVDDAAQGVTDIVRGADLFAATDVHRLLQALLDLPVPRYHHHRLIVDADGRRLAKRDGALSLAALRAAGASAADLVADLRRGVAPLGFHLADA